MTLKTLAWGSCHTTEKWEVVSVCFTVLKSEMTAGWLLGCYKCTGTRLNATNVNFCVYKKGMMLHLDSECPPKAHVLKSKSLSK